MDDEQARHYLGSLFDDDDAGLKSDSSSAATSQSSYHTAVTTFWPDSPQPLCGSPPDSDQFDDFVDASSTVETSRWNGSESSVDAGGFLPFFPSQPPPLLTATPPPQAPMPPPQIDGLAKYYYENFPSMPQLYEGNNENFPTLLQLFESNNEQSQSMWNSTHEEAADNSFDLPASVPQWVVDAARQLQYHRPMSAKTDWSAAGSRELERKYRKTGSTSTQGSVMYDTVPDRLRDRLLLEARDQMEHVTAEELLKRRHAVRPQADPKIEPAVVPAQELKEQSFAQPDESHDGRPFKKGKPLSPVKVEMIFGDKIFKVAGEDHYTKPYDYLLFLEVPPAARIICRRLFYQASQRNRCLVIIEPNYDEFGWPADPIEYIHQSIVGRMVRRVANNFAENGVLVQGMGAMWFQKRNPDVIRFLTVLSAHVSVPLLAIPAAKFYIKQYKAGEGLLPLDLRRIAGLRQQSQLNAPMLMTSYLVHMNDFYAKLSGMEIRDESAWKLLPEQAQRLTVALQGVPLALPQEPWRRYRFRRFVVHTRHIPYPTGQENADCQRDFIETLVVVTHNDQDVKVPLNEVFVDQWDWYPFRFDVGNVVNAMTVSGELPTGDFRATPRNNFVVEDRMCLLRPYHGILFHGDPTSGFYSDELTQKFLQAYSVERSFTDIARIAGLHLWQVLQVIKLYLTWDRAVIVHPICAENFYAVASASTLGVMDKKVKEEFEAQFEDFSLDAVMHAFCPPKTLGQFTIDFGISTGRAMELVCFLLLHRLLKQLHACPVVMMIRVDAEEVPTTEFVLLPKALLNKIRALPLDNWGKEHVRAICRAAFHMGELAQRDVVAQVDTLIHLGPWLNGKNLVEEAAFQTGVRPADVKHMLSTFFELFDVVQAPDVATVA